jgi:hypothetical protein
VFYGNETWSLTSREEQKLRIFKKRALRIRGVKMEDVTGGRKKYRGADESLARPGRKQATMTEDFDFHISYL